MSRVWCLVTDPSRHTRHYNREIDIQTTIWTDEKFAPADPRSMRPEPPWRPGAGKFAGLLSTLGVQRGDVVLSMTADVPEAAIALVGTIRWGAVFGVVDPAAGDLGDVLDRTRAKLLLVEASRKARIDALRRDHSTLWHVVSIGRPEHMGAGDFLFADYFDPMPDADVCAVDGAVLIDPLTGARWTHHVLATARALGPVRAELPPWHPFWPVVGVLAERGTGVVARTLSASEGDRVPQACDGNPLPWSGVPLYGAPVDFRSF